jgi:hypothetical protein
MSQRLVHSSRLSIVGALLLVSLQVTATDSPTRFTGGGAFSQATPSSIDGRFSISARLQATGAQPASPIKQAESAPNVPAKVPANAARFALSAALNRHGYIPKGALTCGPVDPIFQNGFE